MLLTMGIGWILGVLTMWLIYQVARGMSTGRMKAFKDGFRDGSDYARRWRV